MNFGIAFLHGLIWSVMWGIMITITEIKWPHIFLHGYPKELQAVIKLPPFTNKRPAYIFLTVSFFLIAAFIFWSSINTYKAVEVGFWTIFLHVLVICMCWNVFDLVVMDWLIFCTWKPGFIVLPGSEGNKAYSDYKFHFIGFIKGCGISVIGSIIISVLCYIVLKYLLWQHIGVS